MGARRLRPRQPGFLHIGHVLGTTAGEAMVANTSSQLRPANTPLLAGVQLLKPTRRHGSIKRAFAPAPRRGCEAPTDRGLVLRHRATRRGRYRRCPAAIAGRGHGPRFEPCPPPPGLDLAARRLTSRIGRAAQVKFVKLAELTMQNHVVRKGNARRGMQLARRPPQGCVATLPADGIRPPPLPRPP